MKSMNPTIPDPTPEETHKAVIAREKRAGRRKPVTPLARLALESGLDFDDVAAYAGRSGENLSALAALVGDT